MRRIFMVTTPDEKVRHARSLCEKGLWDQVLAHAQTWHAGDPLDHKALFYAGLGFTGLGNYAQAEIMYRQALAIEPRDAKVWNNLGGILFEYLRRPHDGVHCLEQTLKLNPQNKLGWVNLAAMVVKLKMPEKAIAYADQALVLDPNLIEAYLCKAAAARALGRTEIVREVCEMLSTIKPENFRPAR
jgi:tetratricopeptide (TPR) repeat protein